MKQTDIKTGEKYLFKSTIFDHKKHMVGQVFIVVKRIKGKKNTKAFHRNKRGKKPDKFLLCNGEYANPVELKLIE